MHRDRSRLRHRFSLIVASSHQRGRKSREGYSLLEILVVLSIIALIAAVGVSLVTYRHDDEIQQEFTDTGVMLALPRPHAVGDTP